MNRRIRGCFRDALKPVSPRQVSLWLRDCHDKIRCDLRHARRAKRIRDLDRAQRPNMQLGLLVEQRESAATGFVTFKHHRGLRSFQERVSKRNRIGDCPVDLRNYRNVLHLGGVEPNTSQVVHPLPDCWVFNHDLRLFFLTQSGRAVFKLDIDRVERREHNALLQDFEIDFVRGSVFQYHFLPGRVLDGLGVNAGSTQLTLHLRYINSRSVFCNHVQVIPKFPHTIVDENYCAFPSRGQQRRKHQLVGC
mmetsp:Transcript_53767/g.143021  ORF Transcript_53767/g.143021 Transcript_53767/m.143021 type:complete len:249 (-) Transcript_53767:3904-4650(-)